MEPFVDADGCAAQTGVSWTHRSQCSFSVILQESADVKLIAEIGVVFGCMVCAAVKRTEGKVFGFLYFVHAAHSVRAMILLSLGDTVIDDRVLMAQH